MLPSLNGRERNFRVGKIRCGNAYHLDVGARDDTTPVRSMINDAKFRRERRRAARVLVTNRH